MTRKERRDAKKKEEEDRRRGRQGALADKTGETLNAGGKNRSLSRLANRKKDKRGKQDKKPNVGLFVTKELSIAIETTKSTVERIVKDCRAKNKRFRDSEFDLEYDKFRCLHGYTSFTDAVGKDVQRVTEIFDHPLFFPAGGAAQSTAIRQGELGTCYFLSALATVSGLPGLIEKICVARDEEVGVYGFIFYQDKGWVSVIVDDMLYTSIPKWESLDNLSKEVYHEDKEHYNALARKGGQTLVYARSGAGDETWVPIMEKAYAKLYGCFAHIEGGETREAIEDLTGGVASSLNCRDILSVDRFWEEELCKVNKDRLFACAFYSLEAPDDAPWAEPDVQGLHGNHAYAVLRVAEINGKRFVVLRNPWGSGEWNGAWSDGSKEWTPEWLKVLPELGHSFGDDGQFVMEYKDFLTYFTEIDRVLLFDERWTVASSWLEVPIFSTPAAPSYGMLSFIVTIPKKTKTILVLSQLNNRSFSSIPEKVRVTFEYSVVRIGELVPLSYAAPERPFGRSASLELELDAGSYIVYVKLDQSRSLGESSSGPTPAQVGPGLDSDDSDDDSDDDSEVGPVMKTTTITLANSNSQVVSKILTSKVKALSIADNWDEIGSADYLVKPLERIIQEDLVELTNAESDDEDGAEAREGVTDGKGEDDVKDNGKPSSEIGENEGNDEGGNKNVEDEVAEGITLVVPDPSRKSGSEWAELLQNEGDDVVLGLRVYTQTKDPAAVSGRIKIGSDTYWW